MIIDSFTKLGNKTVLSYPLERTYKDIKRMRYLIKILDSICKVEYIGLENLSDNPCILTPNHSSHLDIVCIYKALMECFGYDKLYKMCCLAAKELEVREKGMGKIFRSIGAIPFDRNGNNVAHLKMLHTCINKGFSTVIFPEGTKTRSGEIGAFMGGRQRLLLRLLRWSYLLVLSELLTYGRQVKRNHVFL